MILAGDIGGTSTRLALFEASGDTLEPEIQQTYHSREHASLDDIVGLFVSAHRQPIERACFGIAGPVIENRVKTSNLAWMVDGRRLARALGLRSVGLVNDLEANAHGIAELGPGDLFVLNRGGAGAKGNRAIISAGTGLGEAGLFWDGRRHRPFASEGGHADFSPHDELECELFLYLHRKLGHVSWERVVSGPGLVNLYEFLRDSGRGTETPAVLDAMRVEDAPAVIARAALEGRCSLSSRALDLFVSLYGAEAGNLALKTMATGGVYVGGGVAPKILPRLQTPAFLQAFADKGRFRALMEAIPVYVIVNDKTALLGAARYAANSLRRRSPGRPVAGSQDGARSRHP
jgi:glucokinase